MAYRWNIHARLAAAVIVLASAMSPAVTLARASDAGHYQDASCSTSHREGGQIQIDAIDLPRRSAPHIVDTFTVCNANLDRCAATKEEGVPYWHDADGHLVISHFTETISKTKYRGRTLLESFPICGWTAGEQNPNTADNAMLLLHPMENTLSRSILCLVKILERRIGPNTTAKS